MAVDIEPNIILDQKFYPGHHFLFDELQEVVRWDDSMKARKTASFGRPYNYSQLSYETKGMLACLLPVCECLKERLDVPFNNCLLNLYETGQNTMGFHSDDTSNLLPGTGVAIMSLGSERTISFRTRDKTTLVNYSLKPGSLLYMGADVQQNWSHSIKKQKGAGPRISLTWRAVC